MNKQSLPENPISLDCLLSNWKSDRSIIDNITTWHREQGRQAQYVSFPHNLHPHLVEALNKLGINQLFSHQLESFKAVCQGDNIVLATGTSSGKTLCYNLPILNQIIDQPETGALYFFPTKALTQDQKEILQNLVSNLAMENHSDNSRIKIAVYDGDTPTNQRPIIKVNTNIILSNPDMLHVGILPHHTQWVKFFKNLRFIVIDEIHIYRGVFGSHIANVIRRLKRIVRFYGGSCQFILTSATIGNPKDLAENLIEEPVTLINQDGSPHSPRHFLIYNPPIIHEELGIRQSASSESIRLTLDILAYQVQTILFAQSRRAVEIILRELRDRYPLLAENIHGYRSGYLVNERRAIEKSLRSGETLAVVATNALELGIDIGSMEAIVLVGYPGSIAATKQEIGRAGRRESTSLAILVASPNPLDQYLVRHPDYIIDRSPEKVLINANNLLILLEHIKCSAFELPFRWGDNYGKLPSDDLFSLLDFIESDHLVYKAVDKYIWVSDQYPSQKVSLRSVSTDIITLQSINDESGTTVVGKIDQESALWMTHPEAVYLHQGETYRVIQLDLGNRVVKLEKVLVDYFTIPKKTLEIDKISVLRHQSVSAGEIFYGEIMVTIQVDGYRRISWSTRENLGDFPLELPPTQLRTTGYWLVVNQETVLKLSNAGLWNNEPNEYGPNWSNQKKLARHRDKYTCKSCGHVETDKGIHHVHHKIPFRSFSSYHDANRVDNLITLCPACHRKAEISVHIRSGLAGLGYVIVQLAPLSLMCDSTDLGLYFDIQADIGDKEPTIVIYDQIPAGIGLSDELYNIHNHLVRQALDLVETCQCREGCPSCIGASGERSDGGKRESLALLRELCGSSGMTYRIK
jgi:DEAD/DEAH box helicase domain-containing protein